MNDSIPEIDSPEIEDVINSRSSLFKKERKKLVFLDLLGAQNFIYKQISDLLVKLLSQRLLTT